MEKKSIDELQPNPNNPRTISKDDFASLKRSIKEFGDLSGVVLNVNTGQLVGGHQRIEAFRSLDGEKHIEIAQRLEAPTKLGTVAIGFVLLDGERYGYREVDWDPTKEAAANIAANRITGEFDLQQLAEMTYQIHKEDPSLLELTGQSEKEIEKLMKSVGVGDFEDEESQELDEPEDDKLAFKVTPEQSALIKQALEHVRITKDIPSHDGDSMNGAALFYIADLYLQAQPPLTPEQKGETFTPPEIPAL